MGVSVAEREGVEQRLYKTLLKYTPLSMSYSIFLRDHPLTFPLSSSLSFAGGKTPDPNKRSYADVITEARLRAEEVSPCTVLVISLASYTIVTSSPTPLSVVPV